jgi:hypothetical protein
MTPARDIIHRTAETALAEWVRAVYVGGRNRERNLPAFSRT